ncbi:LysR family transcriptional regulator [Salinibacterium sp. SYSU T00001]|uniref:LysR family transcriptional regulator n=1 Tax=Homoserinimonas sedimenticola TaxID=2986805 RepID=UPI0022360445|nr:LysR family transcriptional regulator [Salinibacterium sedimenticola]MCW4385675.1 LysR family transcriptional regulator [Salinibacterium sedimenticola]
MELRHLRYFTTVVEAGSFTAAAARLHISQPPLSVAIANLESELGVTLLTRTSRGVEPTSAGRYLLDASSRVLGEIDDIVSALGRFGAGTSGSLTMAVVPTLAWHRLPTLIRASARDAPDVEIRFVDPPPWTAIDMLQHRSVDLAAIMVADATRFADRHRGSLDIIDWGPIPLVAALPPDVKDAADPLPLTAFEGEVVLLPRRTAAVPSLPEAVEATFEKHGVTPASIRTVETIQTCIPLIEAGVARAILPDPDSASLSRFDLTVRRLEPEPEPLRALVLARPDSSRNPTIARLLERLRYPRP